MNATNTSTMLQTDVLHSENHVELSAAEIAKAIAHHNHHHPSAPLQTSSASPKVEPKILRFPQRKS